MSEKIAKVEQPSQFEFPQLSLELVEVDNLVRLAEAREKFQVTGTGLTVGVADTGINPNHIDFTGRIVTQKNYTSDNGGDPDNAADGQGHGTNVSGIIAAKRG